MSTSEPTPHLHADEESRDRAADDWGHLVRLRPRAVARPSTVDEIVAAVEHAEARELPYAVRGQGHSATGATQVEGGIVIDTSGFRAVHHVDHDRITVDAGARWSEVLRASLALGRTPPVLTDYLELSVGGTLSVGGIGGASHRHGLQADNVLELEVRTPDGTIRTCSAAEDRALFDAVRGGHGRHGIILRATLRLTPAPERVSRRLLGYDSLPDFLTDQRRLIAGREFDHLEGLAKPADDGSGWQYLLDVATHYTWTPPSFTGHGLRHRTEECLDQEYFEFLDAMAPHEALLRETGAWHQPHPWLNAILPDSAADEVIAETMRALDPADLGVPDGGLVLLYPFHTNAIRTPQCRLPDEPVAFLFALLRTAPADDGAALRRMLDGNEILRRRTLDSGGFIYLEP
ncbi:FAD-binding protein [Saccharopolyspora spinosa]|uniref:FAD/FMN-containing dehydrogenase n=1 Tax=Saccharopolyspora spinosa TaxID=60894 RepID=A0A2N3Y3A6_SACSN|nr:FAD-binding protein [Saccharopolyspora spinosa]PKW17413.1 FAD/FMN-containing dehydrogenase [Saccharopolyspora spinosa]